MSQKRSKIISAIFFIVLISCITYLIFFTAKKNESIVINQIEISGNKLLSESDYLSFTRLEETAELGGLSLAVIKDRFLKHPYVNGADVEFDGIDKIKVRISEKDMAAIFMNGSEPLLMTNEFQVLPIFENIKIIQLPLISNPGIKGAKVLGVADNPAVVEAFKIIESAKYLGPHIYKSLIEVDLRNGGEIVLTFADVSAPVIFGRGGTARKMVYLDALWKDLINKADDAGVFKYIDLRFSNEVYVGSEIKV